MKERNLREMGRLPGFRFHEQDMLDVAALQRLLTPDTVIAHLAARAGVRPSIADPVGYAQANVTGTAAVLEAARRAGVSRIAFGSSSSVYGDSTPAPFREDAVAVEPVSPYAATKRAGRAPRSARSRRSTGSAAPRCGSSPSTGRGSGPTSPSTRSRAAWSRARSITLFGDGTQARDYTYCDDIVAGVTAAIDWTATAPIGLEPFNLGGNRSVPTGAMVAELAQALGIEPKLQWGPMQPGDVQRTAADLTRSGAVLGYAPVTPFPEGIRRFVAWFREAYGRSD